MTTTLCSWTAIQRLLKFWISIDTCLALQEYDGNGEIIVENDSGHDESDHGSGEC